MTYCAYIYYPLKERVTADLLRDLLIKDFPKGDIGPLTDQLASFHPLPNFACQFPDTDAETLKAWFKHRHGALSVLLYPESANLAHTLAEHGEWLGRALYLDLEKLN